MATKHKIVKRWVAGFHAFDWKEPKQLVVREFDFIETAKEYRVDDAIRSTSEGRLATMLLGYRTRIPKEGHTFETEAAALASLHSYQKRNLDNARTRLAAEQKLFDLLPPMTEN